MRLGKRFTHLLSKIFNLFDLSLNLIDLGLFLNVTSILVLDVLTEPLTSLIFVSLTHSLQLLVMFDLLGYVFVLLFNHINVRVEHIDIIKERVVLFFSFDKSRYYFLNRADSSSTLNLVKSVLNHLNITFVHTHQRRLFSVVGLPVGKTRLHQSDRVREFLLTSCIRFLVYFGLGLLEL